MRDAEVRQARCARGPPEQLQALRRGGGHKGEVQPLQGGEHNAPRVWVRALTFALVPLERGRGSGDSELAQVGEAGWAYDERWQEEFRWELLPAAEAVREAERVEVRRREREERCCRLVPFRPCGRYVFDDAPTVLFRVCHGRTAVTVRLG